MFAQFFRAMVPSKMIFETSTGNCGFDPTGMVPPGVVDTRRGVLKSWVDFTRSVERGQEGMKFPVSAEHLLWGREGGEGGESDPGPGRAASGGL